MTELPALLRTIAANRFLPLPTADLMLCGDGDFRAIGLEFLERFIRDGDLAPTDRVLDIGCGIGRMALPLTQYLAAATSYDGFDVAAPGIAWCGDSITPLYPNFRFHHIDLQHALYNPEGTGDASRQPLPFSDGAFDFICLVSVLTHLGPDALLHYAGEIARLLAPGGRCFATAFLMNPPARESLAAGAGRIGFDGRAEGPAYLGLPDAPLAAVAYDEDYFLEKFLRFGLRRRAPATYGHWSGRALPSFQDVCVFERG